MIVHEARLDTLRSGQEFYYYGQRYQVCHGQPQKGQVWCQGINGQYGRNNVYLAKTTFVTVYKLE